MRWTVFIAVFFSFVPSADAATVSVDHGRVTYEAAPGEANRLTVGLEGKHYVVNDSGADLTAGSGCTPTSPHEARCPRDSNVPLLIDGGDGDDELSVAALAKNGADLLGGEGNDAITGSHGDDTLHGEGGRDALHGGGGRDILIDGDGRTPGIVPVPEQPIDSDVLDGGPGVDAVSYLNRLNAVNVDLASGSGGESGEGDQLSGIEAATGGAGDDTLLGNSEPNALAGTSGNDTIDGRGGNDNVSFGEIAAVGLSGGFGNDTVLGGAGDDDLSGGGGADALNGGAGDDRLAGGGGDGVDCGRGRDTVLPSPADVLDRSCERVASARYAGMARAYPLRVGRDGRVTFAYRCSRRPSAGCDVRLRLARGHDSAARRFHVAAGRSSRLAVRLRHGAHGRVHVRVERRIHRGGEALHRAWAWTIDLP
jgi:Ca2+-binding RTX toxin-like protein